MRRTATILMLLSALVLASCSGRGSGPSGSLSISTSGLPAGAEATIAVEDADGERRTVTTSNGEATVARLPVGEYRILPSEHVAAGRAPFEDNGIIYGPLQTATEVTVSEGEEAQASVQYLQVGYTDPTGDTLEGFFETWDVSAVRGQVQAGVTEVRLTFTSAPELVEAEDAGDGSELFAFIDVDVDNDPDTGAAEDAYGAFVCEPAAGYTGYEYYLELVAPEPDGSYVVFDVFGDTIAATAAVDGGDLVITFPTPGAEDGPVWPMGVVSDGDGPTDCLPGSSPPQIPLTTPSDLRD